MAEPARARTSSPGTPPARVGRRPRGRGRAAPAAEPMAPAAGQGRRAIGSRRLGVGLSPMAYTSLLDRLGLHRRELRAWALYDVANSAWMTTVRPVSSRSTSSWSRRPRGSRRPGPRSRFAFATSIAVVLVGPDRPAAWGRSPTTGAARRRSSARSWRWARRPPRRMFFIAEGQWVFALATFVVGNVCVTSTLAFYNSLLPAIAGPRRGRPGLHRGLRPRATSAAGSSSPSTL